MYFLPFFIAAALALPTCVVQIVVEETSLQISKNQDSRKKPSISFNSSIIVFTPTRSFSTYPGEISTTQAIIVTSSLATASTPTRSIKTTSTSTAQESTSSSTQSSKPSSSPSTKSPSPTTSVQSLTQPSPSSYPKPGTLPFQRIVAFGDNFSDNGNGSYAKCMWTPSECPSPIYGGRTNTNGPVAVSYLSDMIKVPLTINLAVGHAAGGSKFGATIDNIFTPSDAGAPSAMEQISSYLSDGHSVNGIEDTLHFLWAGNNDAIWDFTHVDPWGNSHAESADVFSGLVLKAVQKLLNAGAKYVFVPSICSKHLFPVMSYWVSLAPSQRSDNVGKAIQEWNSAVQTKLATLGNNVLYYDVWPKMVDMYNNPSNYGFKYYANGVACDGSGPVMWEECGRDSSQFLYVNFLDLTTSAHKYLAEDMAKVIKSHKW